MNLRGCSGEPNRLYRSYHSGATEDLKEVLEHLARNYTYDHVFLKGFSLGGNLILKYLGETPEAALIRELHEELGIETWQSCLAPLTFASHTYDDFHLLMPLFACRKWGGTPHGRENQTLKWVRPTQLRDYPMPPADIPLIPILRDWL